MYAFIVDFVQLMRTGQVRYFLVLFFMIWLRWFIVNLPALRYRPFTGTYRISKSVIIPVVDEEPEVFKKVLSSINKQRPKEIIVVINGKKNKALELVCKGFKNVDMHWTPKPGKRNP